MKISVNNTELEVIHALKLPSGHGHYKIDVKILNHETNQIKWFSATTSNMRAIDAASELEGTERIKCLYECIESDIIENIEEWISPIQ